MDSVPIFPKRVWGNILTKIEDPRGKLNVIMSLPQLEKGFWDEKKKWLIYEVLPIVFDHLKKSSEPKKDDFCGKKLRQSFFNCRLVSTGACKAIDKYLEEYSKANNGFLPEFYVKHLDINRVTESFLKLVRTRVQNQKRLPIFCRFTHLTASRQPSIDIPDLILQSLQNGELPILKGTGQQELENGDGKQKARNLIDLFRKLCLNYGEDHQISKENTEILEEIQKPGAVSIIALLIMLSGMPNLQILRFDWEYCVVDIPKHLCFSSLPKLSHLKYMELGIEPECASLLNILPFQQYFPQLEELQMIGGVLWKEEFQKAGIFTNLKMLTLKNVPVSTTEEKSKLNKLLVFVLTNAPNLIGITFRRPLSVDSSGNYRKRREMYKFVDFVEDIVEEVEDIPSSSELCYSWKCQSFFDDPFRVYIEKVFIGVKKQGFKLRVIKRSTIRKLMKFFCFA